MLKIHDFFRLWLPARPSPIHHPSITHHPSPIRQYQRRCAPGTPEVYSPPRYFQRLLRRTCKTRHFKGFCTERARLGTFRGFGTELGSEDRERLGHRTCKTRHFKGSCTERARLVTFRGFGAERARLGTHPQCRPQKIEKSLKKKVVRNFLHKIKILFFFEFFSENVFKTRLGGQETTRKNY